MFLLADEKIKIKYIYIYTSLSVPFFFFVEAVDAAEGRLDAED